MALKVEADSSLVRKDETLENTYANEEEVVNPLITSSSAVTFGDWLADKLKTGLPHVSQATFASSSSLSEAALSRFLNGTRLPKPSNLEAIFSGLGELVLPNERTQVRELVASQRLQQRQLAQPRKKHNPGAGRPKGTTKAGPGYGTARVTKPQEVIAHIQELLTDLGLPYTKSEAERFMYEAAVAGIETGIAALETLVAANTTVSVRTASEVVAKSNDTDNGRSSSPNLPANLDDCQKSLPKPLDRIIISARIKPAHIKL